MLYWHFRNLQCILLGFFGKKVAPTDVLTQTFWANLFDTDWLNSIQAGRFFTYTDAARWILAVRMGFFKLAVQKKLVVILGGQKIVYRRPVKLFRKFSISMQITGWDDKWMYSAHVFRQNDQVCCVSFTKIGLRSKEGLFSPISAFKELGHNQIIPPDWVMKHFQDDLQSLEMAHNSLR